MKRIILGMLGILIGVLWSYHLLAADSGTNMPPVSATEKVKVLIIVGGHGYNKALFEEFWKGFSDIACDTWNGSPYTAFDDISQFKHDVILMYNLSSGATESQRQNFLKLLDRGVGLIVWHHALANCQDWPEFEKIAGARFWLKPGGQNGAVIPASGVGGGKFKIHIADVNHPITRGMADFMIEDETYNHQTFIKGIHVLLTADYQPSDKTIAWVHEYGKARVFGWQSGHDTKAWTNENFRLIMSRGIQWAGQVRAGVDIREIEK